MLTDYADFEIDIQPRIDDFFPLAVRSVGGETIGLLRLPIDDPAYQDLARRLNARDTDEAQIIRLGQMLFDALFQGQVRAAYQRSQARLRDGQGLRVKLCIDPRETEVAALPWEFLHDAEQRPLALRNASIVRYLPPATRLATLKTELPLKILLTGARTPPVTDVERELCVVQESLSRLGDYVRITVEPHLTRDKLQALLHQGFDVWHFVGHGGFGKDGKTGRLLLEDATSDVEAVSAPELEDLLSGSGVHLIMLDACESARLALDPFRGLAPALIRAEVPTVIAMQLPILQEAAREFAKQFYLALAEGMPIDSCIAEGRKGMRGVVGPSRADWGIPVVYTQAPDGRLFDLPTPPIPNIAGAINQLAHDGRPAAALTDHDQLGILLSTPTPPMPRRFDHVPRPPRPPLRFLDRVETQRDLAALLQPQRGAWLHGAPGCGLSTLLHQLANADTTALLDGVAYVDGEAEPPHLDDIVQRLFNRFYACDAPLKISADQTYLGDLEALFILDRLPLNRADIKFLATNVLCDGSVLVGAESTAPAELFDMILTGLPGVEAAALFRQEALLEGAPPVMIALLERLCELLDRLPLPLLLVARLIRAQVTTPRQLVDMLEATVQPNAPPIERVVGENMLVQPRPQSRKVGDDALTRAVRLALIALSGEEQRVLAALVRVGGPDALLDALSAISQLPVATVEGALAWMTELRLVEGENGRYAIPFASLRRTLDRLLPDGEERQRAAAFFAAAGLAHAGNLAWLGAERANLMTAIETLLAQGQAAQAGALAQAIQPLLALRGLWSSWNQVITWALQAAQTTGDQALQAWALHERGTHAGLIGDYTTAAAELDTARQLRLRLNDHAGAAASRHNMAYLGLLPPVPPTRPWWRRLSHRMIIGGTIVALLLGSGVATTLALINYAPNAVGDSARTAEDQPVFISVLANDTAQRGRLDSASLSIVAGPAHGAATLDRATGQITYTPNKDYFGDDSLTYQICDDHPECARATASIAVTAVNDDPVAQPDAEQTKEDTPLNLPIATLLGAGSDVDGDTLMIAQVGATSAQNGTVTLSGDTITYQPRRDFSGTDTFTYTIGDGHGGNTTATVTVTVDVVNDDPVVQSVTAETNEDVALTIPVAKLVSKASDADLDILTLNQVDATSAQGSTVTLSGDTITYQPKPDFNGTDTFTYTVGDGHGGNTTATVTITVSAVNDPPTAANDTENVNEDTVLTLPVATLLARTTDVDGDTLTLAEISSNSSKKGHVTLSGDTLTYTPAANFNGTDTFTYTISDGHGGNTTTTVTISVASVNDPPVAKDDTATTDEATTVTIDVLANDSDADKNINPASVSVTGGPSNGTATVDQRTGQIIYTPGANFNGTDRFTYRICDNDGLCAPATVSIAINSVNDAPVAQDDPATTPEDTPVQIDVLANDRDIDGHLDPTSVRVTNGAAHGKTSVDSRTGQINYAPDLDYFGTDRFIYQVCDDGGLCASAAVDVTVTPVNDPPVAQDDTATTDEATMVTIDVLANDGDPENDINPASVRVIAGPEHGTAVVDSLNGSIAYSPNFVGTDKFTYEICDSGAPVLCTNATVEVTVLDKTKPSLNLSARRDGCYGSITVQGTASDQSGIVSESVMLYYRYSNGPAIGAWHTVAMKPDGNGGYSITIDAVSEISKELGIKNGIMEYYMSATDSAGNSGNSPVQTQDVYYDCLR